MVVKDVKDLRLPIYKSMCKPRIVTDKNIHLYCNYLLYM